MATHVQGVELTRVISGQAEKTSDLVAVEEPLEIRLGFGPEKERQQVAVSVTMRTPGHDFELASGFLFTEGIIEKYDQVASIRYCENLGRQEEKENVVRVELKPDVPVDLKKLQRNFYTTSSCGVCGKASIDAVHQQCAFISPGWTVSADIIHLLPDSLRKQQNVFEHTGGLHACGLFHGDGKLELLREDVGRHNALDKVIGAMLASNRLPLSDCLLLVSGRASFELVQKAAMAGMPMLAAIGAPSSLAVQLADACGMTLIGFLRDKKFNCYSHPARIANL
ncbi:MAG: formate dehydrogenase accessory sulfurtransferase FdhD [Cyclobacteriaceae bacterium]|nr:formate dehydrogenase accessory sulfurtransferase FdhD [Cyclobacteriaceae bacterium]